MFVWLTGCVVMLGEDAPCAAQVDQQKNANSPLTRQPCLNLKYIMLLTIDLKWFLILILSKRLPQGKPASGLVIHNPSLGPEKRKNGRCELGRCPRRGMSMAPNHFQPPTPLKCGAIRR
jgi:hypothetical protein